MNDDTVYRFEYAVPDRLADFHAEDFVKGCQEYADRIIGKRKKVALSASGGVDSNAAAYILKDVLGDRLHLFFVADGLRRAINGRPESEFTAKIFSGFPNFEVLDTASGTLPWFEGIVDGTLKRDIFRRLYTVASIRHMAGLGADFIADGTIAPDIAMTEQGRQTQHNLKLDYQLPKLEPLAPLYKPHVRQAAIQAGLPREFAMRIPCPGPAQLLRVGGEFSREKLGIAQGATDIVEQGIEKYCSEQWSDPFHYDDATGVRDPFQYLATCLDPGMKVDRVLTDMVKAITGAQIRCSTMDTQGMWIDMSLPKQEKKLYAPIVWIDGPEYDGHELLELYDNTRKETLEKGLNVPRMLYRVFDTGKGGHPVSIKAVTSTDVKIAEPFDIDYGTLEKMGERICNETGAARVGYDISRRPPATIEMF
jgi:GMP synthase PP-ATPase subunit